MTKCHTCEFDLAIIGGGPSGLAAAINAQSEGLKTVVLDADGKLGGQASTSTKIKNFPGFPNGLTGQELANKFVDQAGNFGCVIRSPFQAVRLKRNEDRTFEITSMSREKLQAAAVLIATGVTYRRLDVIGVDKFLNRGVAYGSPQYNVAGMWDGRVVGIIGGANSAGQAAVYLADCPDCTVHLLVRGEGLERGMSDYLIRELDRPNVFIHSYTEVTEVFGDKKEMQGVRLVNNQTSETGELALDCLFIQIGAESNTGWLDENIAVGPKGFILTDRDIPKKQWPLTERQPLQNETSLPGVFASGDIRATAIRRITTAVADGVSAVSNIHRYFEINRTVPD